MYVARITAKPLSNHTAAQLSKAVASFSQSYFISSSGLHVQPRRQFSSTSRTLLRDYFPEAEHDQRIFKTEAAWPHPAYVLPHELISIANRYSYDSKDMKTKIYFAHREPKDFSDRVALGMVRYGVLGEKTPKAVCFTSITLKTYK